MVVVVSTLSATRLDDPVKPGLLKGSYPALPTNTLKTHQRIEGLGLRDSDDERRNAGSKAARPTQTRQEGPDRSHSPSSSLGGIRTRDLPFRQTGALSAELPEA